MRLVDLVTIGTLLRAVSEGKSVTPDLLKKCRFVLGREYDILQQRRERMARVRIAPPTQLDSPEVES